MYSVMRKKPSVLLIIPALLACTAFVLGTPADRSEMAVDEPQKWALNATAIEACTCPMFCQCYFNPEPAAHSHGNGDHDHEGHYCRFNMAWKVNSGHYGDTDLEGVLFWLAGDLGERFDDGTGEWAVLHFDPAVTEAQRAGLANILGPLFPISYRSFEIKEDQPIEWRANTREAIALLGGGAAAEMRLIHPPTAVTDDPAVLTNIQYWGAPRHDGFVLMPNSLQTYRKGDRAFESSGTNGFMITIDMTSDDV
jgi:hypothetical protein